MKMDAESEHCLAPTSTSVVITTEATLAQNDNHPGQSLPCGNTIFKVWISVVVYSSIYYSEYIYLFQWYTGFCSGWKYDVQYQF